MDPKAYSQKPVSSSPDNGEYDPDSSFSSYTAYFTLTFTSILGVIRARDDLPTVAFIMAFYTCAMLLLVSVHVYHWLPEKSEKRDRLRAPILVLSTAVNVLFAYRASGLVSPNMVWFIWALVVSSSLLNLGCLFYFSQDTNSKNKATADESFPLEV